MSQRGKGFVVHRDVAGEDVVAFDNEKCKQGEMVGGGGGVRASF